MSTADVLSPEHQAKVARSIERRKNFENVWPIIRTELLSHLEELKMPADAIDWYRRNLETNTPGGKCDSDSCWERK